MALLGLLAALPVRLEAQCTLSGSPVSFEPNPPGRLAAAGRWARDSTTISRSTRTAAAARTGSSCRSRTATRSSISRTRSTRPRSPTTTSGFRSADPTASRTTATGRATSRRSPCLPTGSAWPSRRRARRRRSTRSSECPTGPTAPSPCGATSPARRAERHAHPAHRQPVHRVRHPPDLRDGRRHHDAAVAVRRRSTWRARTTTWPGGYLASLAGNYILYVAGGAVQVIDASNPGPVGSITAVYPRTTITSADFGGRTIALLLGGRRSRRRDEALGPRGAQRAGRRELAELRAPLRHGRSRRRSRPARSGASRRRRASCGRPNPGASSALIPSNGDLFVLMWAQRARPTASLRALFHDGGRLGLRQLLGGSGRVRHPDVSLRQFLGGPADARVLRSHRQLRLRLSPHGPRRRT